MARDQKPSRARRPLLGILGEHLLSSLLGEQGESVGKPIDLLQGTLDMPILKAVSLGPLHGYGVSSRIQQISNEQLEIQQGSLYPALYRLEHQGWIVSEWGESDNKRKEKFYSLSAAGRRQLQSETEKWKRMALGAQARQVLLMVLRQASWLAVIGVSAGLGAAAADAISPLDALRSDTHRPVYPGRRGPTVICYCCIGKLGAGGQSFAHPTDAGASSRMSLWPTTWERIVRQKPSAQSRFPLDANTIFDRRPNFVACSQGPVPSSEPTRVLRGIAPAPILLPKRSKARLGS
jgi:PadR family transcriptional regulator PadR